MLDSANRNRAKTATSQSANGFLAYVRKIIHVESRYQDYGGNIDLGC